MEINPKYIIVKHPCAGLLSDYTLGIACINEPKLIDEFITKYKLLVITSSAPDQYEDLSDNIPFYNKIIKIMKNNKLSTRGLVCFKVDYSSPDRNYYDAINLLIDAFNEDFRPLGIIEMKILSPSNDVMYVELSTEPKVKVEHKCNYLIKNGIRSGKCCGKPARYLNGTNKCCANHSKKPVNSFLNVKDITYSYDSDREEKDPIKPPKKLVINPLIYDNDNVARIDEILCQILNE